VQIDVCVTLSKGTMIAVVAAPANTCVLTSR
jgi:hypothetical protein